jgi:hypothetical protein
MCWLVFSASGKAGIDGAALAQELGPVKPTTALRRALDGIVPVLIDVPPSTFDLSMTTVVLPSFAASTAAFCPTGPEPTTAQSKYLVDSTPRLSFAFRHSDHNALGNRRGKRPLIRGQPSGSHLLARNGHHVTRAATLSLF